MGNAHFSIVARTSILKIPESYPDFISTGLPARAISAGFLHAPVQEFEVFADLLNNSVADDVSTEQFNKKYRLSSRVNMSVSVQGGKMSVVVESGKTGSPVETDFGVEKTPLGTFTPAPPLVEDVEFRQVSATRFQFGWIMLGRPHWMAEPLFEEICHRDCVYIWHRIGGHISPVEGRIIFKVGLEGSRFPTHALFINHRREILKAQGALGNLWVSDPAHPKRVTSSGPSEFHEVKLGGGSFGGGGSGGTW